MDKFQKETLSLVNQVDFDKSYNVSIKYNGFLGLIGDTSQKTVNEAITEMKNKIIRRFYIPVKFKDCTYENYNSKENQLIISKIKQMVVDGFKNKSSGKNVSMLFWSKDTYGIGKTHLLYAMIKDYLVADTNFEITPKNDSEVIVSYRALNARVFSEYELLDEIKQAFKLNSEKTEGDVFRELRQYPLLCIDDLVKYTPTNLEFYQRVMFRLVDERYKNNGILILTTNKNLVELAEFLGIATADRLCEMTEGYRFEFKGKSYRSSKGLNG